MIPAGPKLTAQEERVARALDDWADAKALSEAIRGKTPPKVLIAILKRKYAPFGFTVECTAFHSHSPAKKWRFAQIAPQEAAA